MTTLEIARRAKLDLETAAAYPADELKRRFEDARKRYYSLPYRASSAEFEPLSRAYYAAALAYGVRAI